MPEKKVAMGQTIMPSRGPVGAQLRWRYVVVQASQFRGSARSSNSCEFILITNDEY